MHDIENINTQLIDEIFNHFKKKESKHYDEERHCKLIVKIMMDKDEGTLGAFCVEAKIVESTFYEWVNKHELFRDLYCYGKLIARKLWEKEGRRLRDQEYPMGVINYAFEHWKMIGWSRFGIGKNSRIKLNLNPNGTPLEHYQQVIKQASEGDFTASEIKQLMEAVNVGLNTHEKIELQKQIDELKNDLATMSANQNVQNPFTNKGST
jgi:hypothetical protein